MGQNKDAAVGFIGIGIIIVIIVGAIMVLLPEESEIVQNETENENMASKELVEYEKEHVVFDPVVVKQAEKSIPIIQNSFRVILDECNSVRSYSDYIVFATGITVAADEISDLTYGMDKTLTILEISGYDEHHTIGPLIKETRQLGGEVGNCMIGLENKYEN